MALVHVDKVVFGWPEITFEGDPERATIDVTVDGKWVRMGYLADDLPNAAVVQSKLETDSAILLDAEKQHDTEGELGATPEGTAGPVPADFSI